jgi:hypothetical protein
MDQALTGFRTLDGSPAESPCEAQRRAARELPATVRDAGLNWWSVNQPVPRGERVLLIGVAGWSRYDTNTLRHVSAAVRDGAARDTDVYVFDADTIGSQEQLEAVFPGLASGHHTPFVGFWRHGELVEAECGYAGRQIIARALNIDDAPLHRPAAATVSST